MPFTVRLAIDLDLLQLITVGQEYFDEVGVRWDGYSFNRDKIMEVTMKALSNPDHAIFVAYENKTGKILGFFWGCKVGQMWCDEPIAHDIFLYVRAWARGMKISKALISEFIKWCRANNCVSIQVGANSGIMQDAPAARVYQSLGFNPGGYCFNYKL